MKPESPWPRAALFPLSFFLCLVICLAGFPCGAEGPGGGLPGGEGKPASADDPASATLVSALEGGRSFENSLILSWKGTEFRLRALAGSGEPEGMGFRAGIEGRRFMFGPARARGLLAFLSSPLSAISSRGRLPLGLDLASATRGLCLAAGQAAAFALIREGEEGEASASGKGSAGSGASVLGAAGGLSLELPGPEGSWSCLAALGWSSCEAPKDWSLDAPLALPGRSGHLALSRERRGREGSSAFAAGASFERSGAIGISLSMQTIATIRPFSAHASLAAASPAYLGLSGSRPESAAALGLGASLVPGPGAAVSASFKASLARGEARMEGSFPFVSRGFEFSSRLPLPSGGGGSIGPGLAFGIDGKGLAFRFASLELSGESGGEAWSISASAGRNEASPPGGTSCPLSLGLALGPVRGGGRRIETDLGLSLRSTPSYDMSDKEGQAAGEVPRLDCRLGISIPLPAKARLGLVLRMKGARLGIMPAGAEGPVISLDLRYESGTIGLAPRPPPSSLDAGKAVSCP